MNGKWRFSTCWSGITPIIVLVFALVLILIGSQILNSHYFNYAHSIYIVYKPGNSGIILTINVNIRYKNFIFNYNF